MTRRARAVAPLLAAALASCRAGGTIATGDGPTAAAPAASPLETPAPALLPVPQRVSWSGGELSLPATLACAADDSLRPLVSVLDGELRMLAGGRVALALAGDAAAPRCRLAIDRSLGDQEYRLRIGDDVRLTGGSYAAVAMGSVTLLQALRREGDAIVLPRGEVDDDPDGAYRGLLVDVGRVFHEVELLEQIVELARWYKVNHVQLHLTDDQLFTFPTEHYPELPTPGAHYSKAELRRLDEFARVRGVAIVPELEVPGHGGQLTERLPGIFAIRDREKNPGTINMGRDTVYAALDAIIGEIADVFRTSPYIHIGGDEASRDFLADDPDVRRYMARHGLPDVEELYRHFLVRVHESVKRHGKRTIVWEGFHRDGEVEIPRDILVMAWETIYQLPQDLLADGFTLLNVSWKPLYVVGDKTWPVDSIYARWNLWRWENWVPGMPSYERPIQLDPTPRVIGASMASWHQPQHVTLPSTRLRLPAMSDRTWNGTLEPERPLAAFRADLARTDAALDRLLTAVRVEASGLTYPGLEDGHFGEPYWFGDSLVVTLSAEPGLAVRFTLDGSPPGAASPRADRPLVLRESTMLRARAFDASGAPVGWDRWIAYEARPISATLSGWTGTPPADAWELMSQDIVFLDTLTIALSAARRGSIRFTTDGGEPTMRSPAYERPIRLTRSALVRARLFDESGRASGEPWTRGFRRLPAGNARWWKGNTHTHTLWSDGDDFPEMVADRYRRAGYDFLAITDHNTLAEGERWWPVPTEGIGREAYDGYRARFGDWVEERRTGDTVRVRLRRPSEYRSRLEEAGRFLLVAGEEVTQYLERRGAHVNVLNLAEEIPPRSGSTLVDIVRADLAAVQAQERRTGRDLVAVLNHPNFLWSQTGEDLLALPELRFFEVYNGHPLVHSHGDSLHAGTERMWDIVLTHRFARGGAPLYGVATDDTHDYHRAAPDQRNLGRGWIVVRADTLAAPALMAAMERGDFYASTGVELADVRRDGRRIELVIRGEPGVTYTTQFVGTRAGWDTTSVAVRDSTGRGLTRRYSADVGAVLAEIDGYAPVYTMKGDELYVRARVIASKAAPDSTGAAAMAWTQPMRP